MVKYMNNGLTGMKKIGVKFGAAAFVFGLVFVFAGIAQADQQINISVSASIKASTTLTCGDGSCNNGETCSNCPADCGTCPTCPNSVCDNDETCQTCPQDCGNFFTGGGVVISPETIIIFKGFAYPEANLTVLKNNSVIATFKADSIGYFERTIGSFPAGTFTFSIFAEDRESRLSPMVAFTIPIVNDMTTKISQIFIPPTIEEKPFEVSKGENIEIFGESFPESDISVYINPKNILERTKTSLDGYWHLDFKTSGLEDGQYSAKASASNNDGKQSDFSQSVNFSVKPKKCRGADLNFDGKVDLTDFSILLYFWNQEKPGNRCADINNDGIVSIIDFSIMMFYWNE
jgi:hypothetical protein